MKLPTETICKDVVNSTEAGRLIRTLRIKQKVSLRAVAKSISVSAAYLSDLELGKRGWNLDRFESVISAIRKLSKHL
jgi:transcriptional regulator with XRE-family HTH domain